MKMQFIFTVVKLIQNLQRRNWNKLDLVGSSIALEWKLRRWNYDENIKKNSEFIF